MEFSGRALTGDELAEFELLADVDDFEYLATSLVHHELAPGEELMGRDDPADFFALVLAGELHISREDQFAVARPGSIVGELGVASGRPRRGTVTAAPVDACEVAIGDSAAFEVLLGLPGVRRRVRDIAARRIAASTPPVVATLRDGTGVQLRPLLPSDRQHFAEGIREWSTESLQRRFFSGAPPSDALIDYLVDLDHVDHFAWAVAELADPSRGLATARYIRSADDPTRAEIAFGVAEGHRGHGIGTLLLGALGAAADQAGIDTFTAEVLIDNDAMRAVLRKAGAEFHGIDGATVSGILSVAASRTLLPPHLADGLSVAAADIVTAAGIALVVP